MTKGYDVTKRLCVTRRAVLSGGLASLIPLRVAAAEEAILPRIIAERAGYVRISPDEVLAFARDWWRARDASDHHRAPVIEFLLNAPRLYFSPLVRCLLPASTARAIDVLERKVTTDFLLSTRFFDTPGSEHELSYHGLDQACANPFAEF